MANRSFFPVMHNGSQPLPQQFGYQMPSNALRIDPNRSVSAIASQPIVPVNGNVEEFEWIEYLNEAGKSYYYNRLTKVTTWDKPPKFKPANKPKPLNVAPVTALWKEYKNAQGISYYHNTKTNETTWTKPDGFLGDNASTSAETVANVSKTAPAVIQQSAQATPATDIDKAMEATLKQLVPPNSNDLVPVETTDPVAMKQRAFERFKEMLVDKYQSKKINTNQSWDQAVRYIQHDPRFDLVNKISEKKRVFNEWKAQQQKDDRDSRRLATRKAKEDLEAFLLSSGKCRPTLTYQKAKKLFRDEEVWKKVTESDRQDILKDTMAVLKKQHDEKVKQQREKCQNMLNELLDTLPEITYRTTWAQTQRILAANEFYLENDDLKEMDKLDALEIFIEYIRRAEKEHLKEREYEEKMRKRESRKGRDAFYNFLVELNKQGIIKANSTWQSVYPKIRGDLRFTSMLTNTGSTPLDIFKFFVEDLKSELAKEKKKIKQILESTGHTVNMETTFEEFEQWIRSEDEYKKICPTNLRIVFDQLVDKAVNMSTPEDNGHEKKSSGEKNAEIPLTIFENLALRITEKSRWEDCKEAVMAEIALSDYDESAVETSFREYVKNLREQRRNGKDVSEGEVSDDDEDEPKKVTPEKKVEKEPVKANVSRSRSRSVSHEKERSKKSKKEKKAKKSKKKKDKKHKASKYEEISSDEDTRPSSRRRKRSGSEGSERVKSNKSRKDKVDDD
ncbi:unnamed protein product [Bursaphelenchus okinawaensis]|uniref:WW domain-containing protein n=1 Tax=Bursaphelenchus okinawaensis TaxID=465554 RepID=A0A811KI83_9BILA|nr:unnamed protein product [Bursaphelenchus okinawaensis]CAG9105141.1 unnamed protein product [Bursaphelenchus okinawaensis]